MFNNYLIIALRHFRTRLGYSLLNVVGLALGLSCFTLIALFVHHEWSHDRHYDKADVMVRLEYETRTSESIQRLAQSPPSLVPDIVEELPDVVQAVRIKPPRQTWMVGTKDRNFSEKLWAFADRDVFGMFDIELVNGNPQTALEAPFTVVISQEMARKYFGSEDVVGRVLTLDNQYDFEVTAVMAPMTDASHLRFEFLASFESLRDPERVYLTNAWEATFPFSYTYLELASTTDLAKTQSEIEQFVREKLEVTPQSPVQVNTYLKPVTDIHLRSHLQDEIAANGSSETVGVFGAIALFMLLIACINFMNLATARSAVRAREVGIRKTMGAVRRQLMGQFLGEAVLTAVAGLLVSLVMSWLALTTFNDLTGRTFDSGDLFGPGILATLLGVALLAGLLAGTWPAVFLSSFLPSEVLKGSSASGGKRQHTFRNALVVFQFTMSIGLVIATLTVYKQMEFATNLNPGFESDQVLSIELTDPTPASRFPALKARMLELSSIMSVSGSVTVPGGNVVRGQFSVEGHGPDERFNAIYYGVGYDFVETMGMEILAGRDFSRSFPSDTLLGVLINEAAVQAFGWGSPQDALGKEILFNDDGVDNPRVIGVLEDFHTTSIHETVGPVLMLYQSFHFYALARMAPGPPDETLTRLEAIWKEVVPGYEFSYAFLDEQMGRQYESEQVLQRLLLYFAVLTILIACLGLFGLSSFAAERRRKEIGIRKALGAGEAGVALLLTRNLAGLVLPSFLLAAPLTWLVMQEWLSGFAYATDQSVWTFVLAFFASLSIAAATVAWQSVRAARANPVESLRYG